jgi:hypothetical protein
MSSKWRHETREEAHRSRVRGAVRTSSCVVSLRANTKLMASRCGSRKQAHAQRHSAAFSSARVPMHTSSERFSAASLPAILATPPTARGCVRAARAAAPDVQAERAAR